MVYRYFILILLSSALLSACSGNSTAPGETSTPPVKTGKSILEDKARTLFEEKCIACHGDDGTAGIGNAANLQTSQLDSSAIITAITNGKNAMPAFKGQLSEDDIQQLKSYITSLRK